MNRRGFITGLISFVAAPAIVRASSLMPIKPFIDGEQIFKQFLDLEVGRRSWEADWVEIADLILPVRPPLITYPYIPTL
jgi:hypothetical protein